MMTLGRLCMCIFTQSLSPQCYMHSNGRKRGFQILSLCHVSPVNPRTELRHHLPNFARK